MADMNDLKAKVMNTIGTVADMTKDVASKTASSAKTMARIAKLSVEINGERDTIKKAYTEIGKLYYEAHKNDPEGFFTQLCDEISVAAANISEKEAEIETLKTSSNSDDDYGIEVEFEEVASDDGSAGENCGCGCDEHKSQSTADKVDSTIEKVVEKVSDAVEEVIEAVKETIEDINVKDDD